MTSVKPNGSRRPCGCGLSGLTAREKDILRQVERGATTPEIAAALQISCHTVKTHLGHIFRKLDVHNRTQAAIKATHFDLGKRSK